MNRFEVYREEFVAGLAEHLAELLIGVEECAVGWIVEGNAIGDCFENFAVVHMRLPPLG